MRHLLTLRDFTPAEIMGIVDYGIKIKGNPKRYSDVLKGKTLAMIFQKTSTRTRVSFEAAMTQLGGHAQYLDWRTTNFTLGSLKDEIKCLSRYVDIIMARVYRHEDVKSMAEASSVPVINGLCNLYHPCQILADLMTVKEMFGKLNGLKLAYIGDGNNVCNSLLIGCTKAGMTIGIASPEKYKPKKEIVEYAERFGTVTVTTRPMEAINNADIVYTDTWVSMGQEKEAKERLRAFKDYQLNKKLLGNSKAVIMHCLPAHRGYEITDDVIDSKNSIVYDQAENRLHASKAIILTLLTGKKKSARHKTAL